MADIITIDVNEKPAIDGFENLIDEIVKTDKATDRLEESGNKAVSTINRIRPASAQSSAALGQMGERVSQLGVQFSTGSEKLAGFVPNLMRLGPAGGVAVAAVAGIAGGLAILNNTGLRDGKSNLDRLGGAFGNLYKEIGPNIDILKTADNTITGISDTIISNTEVLTENTRKWVAWIKGVEDTKKTDEFFARTQSGFEKLREEEKRLTAETDKRKQSEEIANVKTIEEISNRLKWLREEQSQIVLNTMNEKERDQKLQESFQKRAALEARLTELEKSAAAERAAAAKYWADLRIDAEKRVAASYKQQRDFEAKAYEESIAFQKRVAKDFAEYQRGLASDRREGFLDTAEAIVRARNEEEKALAERLQGEAREAAIRKSNSELDDSLHVLRIKRIKEEMNQRLQATKVAEVEEEIRLHQQGENDSKLNTQTRNAFKQRTAELEQKLKEAQQDAAKIVLDADRKLAVEEADFKRQQLVRQIQDRTEAARKQIQVEKDKKAALDGVAKGASEGVPGLDASAILKAQRPEDVRRQLIERARRDAGPDKKDQADAARQAAQDFARGKVDPTKMAQAEMDAANKTVGAMVSSGKLDQATGQAIANQIRIAAQQQAETDQLKKRMDELQKIQDALINASNPNRNRAGAGGQKG